MIFYMAYVVGSFALGALISHLMGKKKATMVLAALTAITFGILVTISMHQTK